MLSLSASEADSLTRLVCAAHPHLPSLSHHMRQGKKGRGETFRQGEVCGTLEGGGVGHAQFFFFPRQRAKKVRNYVEDSDPG